MKNKEIKIVVTNQTVYINQSRFDKSDVVFEFKGHEISNNFFKKVLLGIKIIFNRIPRLYHYTIFMRDNVFIDSKVRSKRKK